MVAGCLCAKTYTSAALIFGVLFLLMNGLGLGGSAYSVIILSRANVYISQQVWIQQIVNAALLLAFFIGNLFTVIGAIHKSSRMMFVGSTFNVIQLIADVLSVGLTVFLIVSQHVYTNMKPYIFAVMGVSIAVKLLIDLWFAYTTAKSYHELKDGVTNKTDDKEKKDHDEKYPVPMYPPAAHMHPSYMHHPAAYAHPGPHGMHPAYANPAFVMPHKQ